MLLDDVKQNLGILFEDRDTDIRVHGIIERGKDYLRNVAGRDLDFEADKQPKALLLDYVRYAWCDRIEEFDRNFQPQLLILRIKGADDDVLPES